MPNDHYVTNALTEPWRDGAFLWCFDFADRKIRRESASKLFAKQGLNSPENEAALNKFCESPLLEFRHKLRTNKLTPNKLTPNKVSEWRVFRALLLFPLVQTARILHLRDPQAGHLDKFFAPGEQGLNEMARERHENSHVMTLGVQDFPNGWLFYPEIGFFQFPAPMLNPSPDLGLSGIGVAVPLTPYLALAAVPKGADLGQIEKSRGLLQSWSVGLNDDCRRIAIPSAVLRKHQDAVCDDIVAMRERIILLERLRRSANELAKDQL
ncbi:hypothetical protein [Corallococcus exiguus]|uniref:DUF4238 domain-containing protein n=1 Tax=Corallococcus exiguus TaxID=83462 RepID=A0A7X4YA66_9BACT|nr:hypothetical protein [Corallococcus exiguus]NBC41456.1 hypothetical protein [Corallococcus exiguus]TNV67160.1 hypothetical protein FH620_02765 [Corallococcus exiguus]